MGMWIVAISLALIWFGLCGSMIFAGFFDGYGSDAGIGWLGVLFAALGVGIIVWAYGDSNDPDPRIALRESEWECAQSEVHMVPMLVGKVIINQPQTRCIEYRHR